MSEFTIQSSSGSYEIIVGLGCSVGAEEAGALLIDPVVRDLLPGTHSRVVEVIADEEHKTLASCEDVIVELNRHGLRRGERVVAVGGGAVQDVATLSCSLYMRGVDWEYVPTTLMAMADSCIGGKSSINAGGVKNLVGNFHPPRRVYVDPTFVTTLPQSARVAGLAEAVKICFARGADAFDAFLESTAALAPGADDSTVDLVGRTLLAKKWFVEIDEFDRAERRLLNFGHSFAHAWEAACHYRVQHGEAVAAGMLAALRHPAAVSSERTLRLADYSRSLLATVRDEVADAAEHTDWNRFITALASDKKNSTTALRLVLPTAHDGLELVELPLDRNQLDIAAAALRSALTEAAA